METKQCPTCGEAKELNKDNFAPYVRKNDEQSWKPQCCDCTRIKRRAQHRKSYNKHKDKINKQRRENYEPNSRRLTPEQKAKKAEYSKRYRTENKERLNKHNKEWRDNNRQHTANCLKQRRDSDPTYRLKVYVPVAVRRGLQGRKSNSTFDVLSYTPKQLRAHLESQFEDWMNWDNWGRATHERRTWNIDHIHPQSLLPYDSLDHPNFQKCWALQNLQPLETYANIRKGNRLI